MDLLLRRSHIKVGPVADWANDQHKSNGFLRHKAYESPEMYQIHLHIFKGLKDIRTKV